MNDLWPERAQAIGSTGNTSTPAPGFGRFRSAAPLGLESAAWPWSKLFGAAVPQRPAESTGTKPAEVPGATATLGPHQTSGAGLQLIMDSEGFGAELYDDPAGHCTIGFGHLVHKGKINGMDPSEARFRAGITRTDAEALLRQDVQRFEQLVNRTVTVPLTQAQFDALVDFAYNLGFKAFRSSTMLIQLNAGNYAAVPAQLRRFVKAGGLPQPGLVKRREREAEMFESGVSAAATAAKPRP